MAVPKRKTSKSKKLKRRSHSHLNLTKVVICLNCGSKFLPHNVCKACGYYNNKEIINIKVKAAK